MAVKVSTWVWDNLKEISGTELIFMLALADKSNDEEGACFPGVKRLQEMCRLSTERAIQKVSAKLQESGHIGVELYKGIKTSHGNTNRYYINGYRQSIGLPPIYSGNHPMSKDKELRLSFIKNPEGKNGRTPQDNDEVNQRTPQEVNNGTPDEVNQRTPKPLEEPSGEHIADYAALQNEKNHVIKEKKQNPYYDAIKEYLDIHGGQNADYQKMLMGTSKKNGYKEYNLSPAMDVVEFIEWALWAKKTLGQYMVKSPAKVNGSITKWREMGSPKVNQSNPVTPTKPTNSMSAARAMAMLNQMTYEDTENGS